MADWTTLRCIFLAGLCGMLSACSLAQSSRYECWGELTSDGRSTATNIFIELEDDAWVVGLWSDSDGALYIENPGQWVTVFLDIQKNGHQHAIHDHDGALKGNFSTLSGRLMLDLPAGFYDGDCRSAPSL